MPIDSGVPDAGPPDAGKADAGKPDAGRPDAGPVDAGFVAAPIDQWCRLNAAAQCDRSVRCLSLAAANVPECISSASETLQCDQVAYTRAVKEGRMQYLEPKAIDCLNAYARGSCEDTPPACEVVFAGTVPPDAGCILTQECNSSGFCYQYDYTCPHRCRGWRAMGEGCDGFSTRCKPDEAYCGSDDGGFIERCLPLKGLGEDCPSYDSCRADLACATVSNAGKCVKRSAGPGETCGERQGFPYCGPEYFCRQNQMAMPIPPGTCERRGGLGAVCAGYGGCLPSLRCSSAYTTATCIPRSAEGEPCSNYGECQDGLYCPTATMRCAKIPGDGGDCTSQGSSYQCASAHFCDFNAPQMLYVCRPRQPVGSACSYDGTCLSNDCDYGSLPDGGYGGSCVPSCSQKADGGF